MRNPDGQRSPVKIAAALRNLKLASAALQLKHNDMVLWKCARCGIERMVWSSHQKRMKYCSKSCGALVSCRGKANPNFKDLPPKICRQCATKYQTYNHRSKFCSHACYVAFYATEEGKKLRSPSRGGTKDKNHDAMVTLFESMGCSVLETHTIGGGFPDIILGLIGETVLVEVKNPETAYGRAGLSESQRKMSNSWRGSKVTVVKTQDEAVGLVQNIRERVSRGRF